MLVIGTPKRFPCGQQIDSYMGLISSEDSRAGHQLLGHISKQGKALLRFLKTRCAFVLDVAKGMGLCTVLKVRFVRGKARNRTWRELKRRPPDWASRSLQREFEVVIMVEVLIGEVSRIVQNISNSRQ